MKGYISSENPAVKINISFMKDSGGIAFVRHVNCHETASGFQPGMRLEKLTVNNDGKCKECIVIMTFVCVECKAQQVVKFLLHDTRIWNDHMRCWWTLPKNLRR
ncbi:MAG: hypothetical protein QXG08_07155 [Candidatus Methanomethyliaceae archaeon]